MGFPAAPSRQTCSALMRWAPSSSGGTTRPGRLELSPEAYRPVPHGQRGPGAARDPLGERLGRERRGGQHERPGRATRRRTPRRGGRRAPRATSVRRRRRPGASASSELTPTSGSPRACASARAVAIPIRRPGEAARPDADRDPVDLLPAQPGAARAPPRPRPAAGSRARAARPGAGSSRTSTTVPAASSTPATVAVVAVSRPRTITSPPASAGRRRRARARRGARSAAAEQRLGPPRSGHSTNVTRSGPK